jgi:hypothetical protein
VIRGDDLPRTRYRPPRERLVQLRPKEPGQLLEALKEKVGEYPRPIDSRHALVASVNIRGPNVFVGLPYGRKLNGREGSSRSRRAAGSP